MLIQITALISVLWAAGVALWLHPVGLGSAALILGSAVGAFLVQILVIFLMAWVPSLFLDPDREFTRDSRYFRILARLCAPAVFPFLLTRIQVTGREKLPRDGRFLLVCNHIANLDSGVLLAAFPDSQLAFLAKKEVREMFLIGPLMGRIGCQFLDRENDRAALRVIIKSIQNIREDKVSMAAFPEGGVIKDGRKLHHFRNGVFKVAMKPQVPVVVCTIRGTTQIPANLRRLKRTVIDLRVLDVVTPERYAGMRTPELGQLVYDIMRADFGPEADGSL